MIEGVDYSTDRPFAPALESAGKQFAARYVGLGTADKHLTLIEGASLAQHGISIVAVAEGTESAMLGGRGFGQFAAQMAYPAARDLGMPDDRPIYFAVDFDCTAEQWPAVRDALAAIAEIVGVRRVGVYGSYNVVEWAKRDNVADWFWQTYAWSHGQWSRWTDVQQYQNNVPLGGGTVDLDRATSGDYGQWMPWRVGATKEETVKYIRTDDGGIYREDGTDPANGFPILWHVANPDQWEVYAANGDTFRQVQSIDWTWYTNGETAFHSIQEALSGVKDALAIIADHPPVDPVAVANALANRPEIARTLAEAVAAQLASISGSMTLSGSLSARITPPAV